MKNIFLVLSIVFIGLNGLSAQEKKERKSPAAESKATVGDAEITINYSSPSVKGRAIFGDLVPFGKVWRTGANEATVFEISNDLMVNGQKLPAGKYGLFTIPNEDNWVIVFNSKWEQWGAYKYKEKEDVLRVEAKPETLNETVEMLSIDFKADKLSISWDKVGVAVDLK
ncbi:MAG: DUF2911 domain-containing protein [Salibacteraceae bacterium]